jgi:hypothetical protein
MIESGVENIELYLGTSGSTKRKRDRERSSAECGCSVTGRYPCRVSSREHFQEMREFDGFGIKHEAVSDTSVPTGDDERGMYGLDMRS